MIVLFSFSFCRCGVVAVDPPCYLSENKALSYPACCPEPICPESVEESTEYEPNTKQDNKKVQNSEENTYDNYKFNNNNKNKNNINKKHQDILNEDHNDSENELSNTDDFLSQQNGGNNHAFRSYPWDDDYLYGDQDQDHMDNNVEDLDLQYLDYYPTDNRRASPRFARHDFNIANFKWF